MLGFDIKISNDEYKTSVQKTVKKPPQKTLERTPQRDGFEKSAYVPEGALSEYKPSVRTPVRGRPSPMIGLTSDGRYYIKAGYKPKGVAPLSDTPKISQAPATEAKTTVKTALEYVDDGIMAIDGYTEGAELRAEMREAIFRRSCLGDENLAVKPMDDAIKGEPQLSPSSRYYELGTPRINKKNNQIMYICENLRDMPDMNGVRGKTPLFGVKNVKGFEFRMGKLKEYGIKTIIDLRAEGECSEKAKKVLEKLGLNYVNFPVEDSDWTEESIKGIKGYLDAVNEGDFYVGCANGEARTDLAICINYILNPEAKEVPKLYFGSVSSSRVSVKQNMVQILELVKQNPDIVKEWGWNSYEEFKSMSTRRMTALLDTLKG